MITLPVLGVKSTPEVAVSADKVYSKTISSFAVISDVTVMEAVPSSRIVTSSTVI